MKSLQGKLLLASPAMDDPNFNGAVILLVEHGQQGALGLVLNKPTSVSVREVLPDALRELVDDTDSEASALRHGGPCRGPLMVLHRCGAASQIEVLPGMHFATEEALVAAVLGEAAQPVKAVDKAQRVLFFAGYAGWGPGQLEGELADDAWVVAPGDVEAVFGVDVTTWTRLVREVSRDTLRQSMNPKIVPPDASLN